MNVDDGRFAELLQANGIILSSEQSELFDAYYRELAAWNDKMNLTAITERKQVYIKHFYDSASLSFFISFRDIDTVADIGSGAGFPGIPLKILFPHIRLTLVDSLAKRVRFLNHIVETLGLKDVACLHARAEDAARQASLRDRFDLVTARAVARLNVLAELCLPFVRKDGLFAAMKGANAEEELEEAKTSLRELRSEFNGVYKFQLPDDSGLRHIILIRKYDRTPSKYPRKAGLPERAPLKNIQKNVPRET
jgi:16S rRNA (guanine527-N7)-methyltransferase